MTLPLLTLVFVAGFLAVWFGLPFFFSNRNWVSTTGRIATSFVEEAFRDSRTREREFRYVLGYDYNVNGRNFRGDKVYPLLPHVFRRRAPAEALMAQYPVGAEVVVYYRPDAPDHACLLPQSLTGTGQRLVVALIAGLALAVVSGAMLWAFRRGAFSDN